MKTDPTETARSSATPRSERRSPARLSEVEPISPEAIAVKVRYVGALSRKLDRRPDIQKYCHGALRPNCVACDRRISRAGIIVIKIPRKTAATSKIGCRWK